MSAIVCSACGAPAPPEAALGSAFVCTYCHAPNTLAIARAPAETMSLGRRGAADGRGSHSRKFSFTGIFAVIFLGGAVALLILRMSDSSLVGGTGLADCKEFSGTDSQATWGGCQSGIVRELSCSASPLNEKCSCLRDGVEQWFFFSESPPSLSARDTAERIGKANCKRW